MPKPPRSAKFKQGGRPHARRLIAGRPARAGRGPQRRGREDRTGQQPWRSQAERRGEETHRGEQPQRGQVDRAGYERRRGQEQPGDQRHPGGQEERGRGAEAAPAGSAPRFSRHRAGQMRRPHPARGPGRQVAQAGERFLGRQGESAAPPGRTGLPDRTGPPPPAPRRGAPAPPPVAGEALYGLNPVLAALQTRQRLLRRLYVRQGRLSDKLAQLVALAQQGGLALHECTPEQLQELCGSSAHQGAVLACGPLPRGEEQQALAYAAASGPLPLLVVLDEIEDPQNLGAIVRSCAQFGVAGVVVPRHHGAPLSPAASKASAGELERLPVFEAANLARFLEEAKGRGFWVAGTVPQGGTPLPGFRQETPLVLVMGNEGRGLRPLVERHCDVRLTIPLLGAGSLNVSAATAVLLYHLRQPLLAAAPVASLEPPGEQPSSQAGEEGPASPPGVPAPPEV